MVSLLFVFWMFIILFGVIGANRGWAKELLVVCSVILALAFIVLIERYIPPVRNLAATALNPPSDASPEQIKADLVALFWIRSAVMSILVFFGYQTPNISRFAAKMAREKFQDILFGFIFGIFNGFLTTGSIWYFLYQSKYPFDLIIDPAKSNIAGIADTAARIMPYLPPNWLGVPGIYFAVVVAFIFVIVVFI